jgi:hypothetical protein
MENIISKDILRKIKAKFEKDEVNTVIEIAEKITEAGSIVGVNQLIRSLIFR